MSKVRWYLVTSSELTGTHVINSFESQKEAEIAGREWFMERAGDLSGRAYYAARGKRIARKFVADGCELCPVVLNGE